MGEIDPAPQRDAAKSSNVVVFTGAGASAAFGYPLTKHLLPQILDRLGQQTLFGPDVEAREKLGATLRTLFPGLPSLGGGRSLMITDVLSLLDHAIEAGTALHPKLGISELRRTRDQLGRALHDVLGNQAGRPAEQQRFLTWITSLTRRARVAVVSTNYDLTVDQQLLDAVRGRLDTAVDLGFDWRDTTGGGAVHPRPVAPEYRIFKLHGSLNWLKCDLCEHVYMNPNGAIAHRAFDRQQTEWSTCHCGYWPLRAHLVAPSLVRDIRDPTLLSVWRSTLEALREADEWYFIGYSLPSEDVAIRSLLLRAFHMRERAPRVTVVQFGPDAKPGYELMFPGCHYLEAGVSAFLDDVLAGAS